MIHRKHAGLVNSRYYSLHWVWEARSVGISVICLGAEAQRPPCLDEGLSFLVQKPEPAGPSMGIRDW